MHYMYVENLKWKPRARMYNRLGLTDHIGQYREVLDLSGVTHGDVVFFRWGMVIYVDSLGNLGDCSSTVEYVLAMKCLNVLEKEEIPVLVNRYQRKRIERWWNDRLAAVFGESI